MAPFNGDGNGDFSQSLVRHQAVTSADSESVNWSPSVTHDAGTVIGMLNEVLQKEVSHNLPIEVAIEFSSSSTLPLQLSELVVNRL